MGIRKYHIVVAFLLFVLAAFHLKTELIMSGISQIVGKDIQLASVHANYLSGLFTFLILAYLIKKQES